MRLKGPTFWGMLLAVLAIDASAGTDVISNHQAVNQIVVLAASAGVVGLLLNQAFPAPVAAIASRLRTLPLVGTRPDPFIPLPVALRELYEANVDKSLGLLARGVTDGTEADILEWLGYWVTQRSVVVYGRRPPSLILEPMPADLHRVGGLEDGAARFASAGFDTWTDLSVKRDAFRAMIPALGETPLSGLT